MSFTKIGTNSGATQLKNMLINDHDFELSKGSAISPFVTDPKYKEHKNRRKDWDTQPQLFYHKDLDPDNLPDETTAFLERGKKQRRAAKSAR
jgi:hypothetical protein